MQTENSFIAVQTLTIHGYGDVDIGVIRLNYYHSMYHDNNRSVQAISQATAVAKLS